MNEKDIANACIFLFGALFAKSDMVEFELEIVDFYDPFASNQELAKQEAIKYLRINVDCTNYEIYWNKPCDNWAQICSPIAIEWFKKGYRLKSLKYRHKWQ